MWYTGFSGYSLDNVGAIGYAYSNDGINWNPDTAPSLQKSNTWQSNGVGAPWVIRSSRDFYIWYTGIDSAYDPTIGYAYYHPPGGGGGGGGIPSEPSEPGITDVSDVVTDEGVFTETTTITCADCHIDLIIDEDTTGLTAEGEPLSEISITEMEDPPDPPADANVICLPCNLGPSGAIFIQPIDLIFTYDPALLPEGVSEENLVIAFWDGEKWVNLECTVDPVTNTITACIGHFTPFAVLAYTGTAVFVPSELSIYPTEVNVDEEVTITVLVTNTGDLEGTYQLTLKINQETIDTEEVTLAGHASRWVSFTTTKDVAGTYAVAIDGLSGTFEVAAPQAPTSWWVIAAIIAAVVAAIAVPVALRRRRRI
jgi:hypothetical protein